MDHRPWCNLWISETDRGKFGANTSTYGIGTDVLKRIPADKKHKGDWQVTFCEVRKDSAQEIKQVNLNIVTAYRLAENFGYYTQDRELITRIHKELSKINQPPQNNPIIKSPFLLIPFFFKWENEMHR